MKLVLDTTDASPGPEFTVAGGWCHAICDTHTGGTWTLEVLSLGGIWVADDSVEFDGVDVLQFRPASGQLCRFAGGDTGARIECNNILG